MSQELKTIKKPTEQELEALADKYITVDMTFGVCYLNGLEEFAKAVLDEYGVHNTVIGVEKESHTKQPDIAVWYGSMPESNGKENWTAIMHRKSGSVFDDNNITIDRSEYPDRVRYEADRVRYLIGELTKKPSILDYDSDKKSLYEQKRLGEQNAK